MEATAHPISQKDINNLARNHPVAVIVGVAGFIGSHLADHLLKLKIQVIGIDDMSGGKSENLHLAWPSNNFYFYNLKIEDEEIGNVLKQLPRLDYAFFAAKNTHSPTLLDSGLKLFLEVLNFHHQEQIRRHHPDSQKPKSLLLSSIELYDNKHSPGFEQMERGEIFFAKYANENRLNARVVRLGDVFGPRMDLNEPEVFSRLIKATLDQSLAKENPTHDFSTRGIYIDDAINLITKAMLLGASANKIFDGVQISPLKVEEVKQVLLDPKWYQEADFKFTQLPPWETPNLAKTVKELAWRPRANIISALRETLHYFSKYPPEPLNNQKIEEVDLAVKVEDQKIEEPNGGELNKVDGWSFKEMAEPEIEKDRGQKSIWPIFNFLLIWLIILLGLVYPLFVLIAGNFIIPQSLKKAEGELMLGDFKNAQQEVTLGYLSAKEQDNIVTTLAFLKVFNVFGPQIDSWINLSKNNVEVFQNIQQLVGLSDKFVSNLEQGNLTTDSLGQMSQGESEVEQNLANSIAKNLGFNQTILGKVDQIALQDFYNILIQTKLTEQNLASLLSSSSGSGPGSQSIKQYLVILVDNKTARPTGGAIKSLALVKVGNGKVVDISSLSLSELDGKLPASLVPEDLVKANLNITSLKLSNSNFDGDYPTFAKTFETLYLQAGGGAVDGVLSVDTQAAGDLVESLAGINLDVAGRITTKDEVIAIVAGEDLAQKDQLLKQLLVKLFGISRQNIFKVGQKLGLALNQKDILVFANDTKLENRFIDNGWSGILSQINKSDFGVEDLVAVDIYDFNGSAILKKQFSDQITIDEQGLLKHDMETQFTEQGNRAFKGEVMIYLPVGIKINKISLGNEDLGGKVSQYVKYGLSGVSLPLSLNPGENKNLVLSYQLPTGFNFGQGSASYKYRFLKQAGSTPDPLILSFNYPEDINISDNLNPNNLIISGKQIPANLNQDQELQLNLKK